MSNDSFLTKVVSKKIALVALMIAMIGCSQNVTNSDVEHNISSSKSNSIWVDSLNATVPGNFFDEDFILVKSLKEIPGFTTSNDNVPNGFFIENISKTDFNVDGGYEAAQVLSYYRDVYGDVYGKFVITGLGIRIRRGDVRSLTIEFRKLNTDGSLGTRYRLWNDSHPSGTAEGEGNSQSYYGGTFDGKKTLDDGLETWIAADDGYVLSAVAMSANKDDMEIQYCKFNRIVSTGGSFVLQPTVLDYWFYDGGIKRIDKPNRGHYEVSWTANVSENFVPVGIGLGCTSGGTLKTLTIWQGNLVEPQRN